MAQVIEVNDLPGAKIKSGVKPAVLLPGSPGLPSRQACFGPL
jgi:hypothetical protein